MEKNNIMALKNNIYRQILAFEMFLLDCKSVEESKKIKIGNKVHKLVDEYVKQGIEDVDLWVFLKYRDGKVLSKKSQVVKVEPKSLNDSLIQGFEIPETASIVQFEIRPVWLDGYNRFVETENIYEIKFGLNDGEELTLEQFKRRFKLTSKDYLFSVEDMKSSKILRFYTKQKQIKRQESGKNVNL